jgi:hypothetical protein
MLDVQKIKISLLVCLFLPAYTAGLLAAELQAQNTRNSSNDGSTSFVTPSGNIYCALIGGDQNILRCEIRSMLNPLPPQPYPNYCEFDWGAGFLLRQQGKPEVLCISDTIAGSRYTLSYNKTWTNSGFKCVSKRTELICNNSDGHGFSLSRNKWNAF